MPRLTLGESVPQTPVLLDTNVFINALAGRGPPMLRRFMEILPRLFVGAPTRAELSWVRGRLDPGHPNTALVVRIYENLLSTIDPAKVLVPEDADWLQAGELAGRVAKSLAGAGGQIATAFDRVELISDSLAAVLASKAGVCVVTEDAHFETLCEFLPGLEVLFYRRVASGA